VLQGAIRSSELRGYTLHEITREDGTVVKEFVSPAGIVFAVSWQGPSLPNLVQLLGNYFPQFSRQRAPAFAGMGQSSCGAERWWSKAADTCALLTAGPIWSSQWPGSVTQEVLR
jgi:hypothetical protein